MRIWNFVQPEIIKTLFTILTLVVGGILGQIIIMHWDRRKKRHERDMASAAEFHNLYGEFKEISRLWNVLRYKGHRNEVLALPENMRFDLLLRATAAEGKLEALIVKLATERHLEKDEIRILGLFRQAYQILRVVIRNGVDLEWINGKPEYEFYNELASKVACIISPTGREKVPVPGETPNVMKQITKIKSDDWKQEIERLKPLQGGTRSS